MFSLTGKVALVTGASRGIGKAIATQLQALGATVIGTATSEHGANKISEYLSSGDSDTVKGMGLVLNVTSDDSIAAMFVAIKEAHGAIDILVNNAGITRDNLFMRMKDDEWQDILDTNLSSVFKVSKAAIRPMMKKRNGRIINIGSVVGSMGNAGQVNYATSKAGLLGFTKSLAREIASRGITVNTVAPGFIETAMTDAIPFMTREVGRRLNSLSQGGKPVDVAETIAFFANPASSGVTGNVVRVCGQSLVGA
jgi:3-oxoacyl-[acyl-carrier protein] reductase